MSLIVSKNARIYSIMADDDPMISAGWVNVMDHNVAWYLFRLYTVERYRRQGYGRRLMNHVCKVADAEGMTILLKAEPALDVIDERAAGMTARQLRRFYKTFGFGILKTGQSLMQRVAKTSKSSSSSSSSSSSRSDNGARGDSKGARSRR